MHEEVPPLGKDPLSISLRLKRGDIETQLCTLPHCACCGRKARLTAWMKLRVVDGAKKGGGCSEPPGCSNFGSGSGLPDPDGCLIILLVLLAVVCLVLLVRLIRYLAGWQKPQTVETQKTTSAPASIQLRFPVCFRHWCFRPGGIRLIRLGEDTIDLTDVSFAFIKDCEKAGLRIQIDPIGRPYTDPMWHVREDTKGSNSFSGEHVES